MRVLRRKKKRYCQMCLGELKDCGMNARKFCNLCGVIRTQEYEKVRYKAAQNAYSKLSDDQQIELRQKIADKIQEEIDERKENEPETTD